MQVTALTHRANPVYPAIIPGVPPNEACTIAWALSRIFLPLVGMAIPEMVDYDLPTFATVRHWTVISIDKTHAGQARRVAHAAWGLPQFTFAKMLIVVDGGVDGGVDVHDDRAVLRAVASNTNPGRDVILQQGPPDPFDPSLPPGELGQKMAIDATAKLPAEHAGPWPRTVPIDEQVRQLVSDRWAEYGLGPEPQ